MKSLKVFLLLLSVCTFVHSMENATISTKNNRALISAINNAYLQGNEYFCAKVVDGFNDHFNENYKAFINPTRRALFIKDTDCDQPWSHYIHIKPLPEKTEVYNSQSIIPLMQTKEHRLILGFLNSVYDCLYKKERVHNKEQFIAMISFQRQGKTWLKEVENQVPVNIMLSDTVVNSFLGVSHNKKAANNSLKNDIAQNNSTFDGNKCGAFVMIAAGLISVIVVRCAF